MGDTANTKSTGGRLSPRNIADTLMRGELYREIRVAQTDKAKRGEDWASYVIQPGGTLMPELIAHKAYGLDTLKWVVLVAAGRDDPRERLEDGATIYLPKTSWLRERIRAYAALTMRK